MSCSVRKLRSELSCEAGELKGILWGCRCGEADFFAQDEESIVLMAASGGAFQDGDADADARAWSGRTRRGRRARRGRGGRRREGDARVEKKQEETKRGGKRGVEDEHEEHVPRRGEG